MEQFLSLLVVLAMVWSCRSWQAPDFCHQSECPEYQVVGSYQVGFRATHTHICQWSASAQECIWRDSSVVVLCTGF